MTSFQHLKRVGLGVCAGLVVACSGGGGDGTAPAAGGPPPAPANNPPTISGTPPTTVTEGQPYSFTPTANDPDGDTLTFSIVSQPVWANFDSATGALTGTPTANHIGTTTGVTLSVSDGNVSASLAPFDLEVQQNPQPANNPPTISGTPPTTVTEGQPYSFTPTANDPDGDTLTFSIVSQPVWANFDTATGALTGTPQAIHIGTTVGVTISVTDGMASASLPAFNLEVQQVQLGSATVSWDVPTTNADGSLLTDLAGYEVHYGTSSGNYSSVTPVNDPNATDVTLNNLQPGTWFFAVKAVDQTGNASAFSAEVSKVIP